MKNLRPAVLALIAVMSIGFVLGREPRAHQSANPAEPGQSVLKPTAHPRLPADASQFWMVPSISDRQHATRAPAVTAFVEGVKLEVDSNYAGALPIFMDPAMKQGTLGDYATYYLGLAELRLGKPADARRTFQALAARPPTGYLVEASALREAESDEAMGDQAAALDIYERLSKAKTTAPDDVLMRMAKAARATGNPDKAVEAYSRVLYEFPFSDLAAIAAVELEGLPVAPVATGSNRYKLELGRAERLFGAKRYGVAKPIFEGLRHFAVGDDRELIDLRIAECDYFLKRVRNARDGVRPYINKASRQGEALFFYAVATRELGNYDEYLQTVRRIVDEFPDQSWAEEALNNLATQYIVQDDDVRADETFREMYAKFPLGRYAERAAWKIGWYAYRNGHYAETVHAFESGAAHFPRSDYRPAWLYWAARSHEALKESSLAEARYTLGVTDYLNTYYGRLAVARLNGRAPERRLIGDASATGGNGESSPAVPPLPPNEHVIRALLGLELYDRAVVGLRYDQKVWGDSSAIQATLGWIYHQRGDLRAGINQIKRAYPQYMAAGGEQIPAEVLKVLFPVDHWPLIRRYSAEHQLDPYLIAALIAQESSFDAEAKSVANAYGLMQLLPSTGRQYARTLQISRRFNVSMLTSAETNIKMGTAYFADLVRQFGTAEDYRRLYGPLSAEASAGSAVDAGVAQTSSAVPAHAPAQKASASAASPSAKKRSTTRKAKKST